MTSLRLYEIADDVRALMESGFDEETGEMLPELVQALAAFEGKGAAVAAYVLNIEAEAEAIAQAAKRITARKRTLDARAEHMRDYLRYNMGLAGIMRIDAADHSFSVTLAPGRDESLVVDDAATFPDSLTRIKREPDKAAIKAAIKAGEPIAGARLVLRDRLTIR